MRGRTWFRTAQSCGFFSFVHFNEIHCKEALKNTFTIVLKKGLESLTREPMRRDPEMSDGCVVPIMSSEIYLERGRNDNCTLGIDCYIL